MGVLRSLGEEGRPSAGSAEDTKGTTAVKPWGSTHERSIGGPFMRMIHLTDAQGVGELAMIKSLLDGNRIAYVVHGEHISSLYPGVPFFVSRVMVDASDQARAEVLLSRLRLSIRETPA
ncbi:MAG: DUF2007 domain-containing protein [Nitrospira sp.]|nr:DUF2007 domain-containing protein [Nitrospira sp.]